MHDEGGFTLVELLLVLLVTAVLTVATAIAGKSLIAYHRYDRTMDEASGLAGAASDYTKRNNKPPVSLSDLEQYYDRQVTRNNLGGRNALAGSDLKMSVVAASGAGGVSPGAPLSYKAGDEIIAGMPIDLGMGYGARSDKKFLFGE